MNSFITSRFVISSCFIFLLFTALSFGQVNWQTQSLPLELQAEDIFFTDKDNGWAVGEGKTILHTTNGGETWDTQQVPEGNGMYGSFFLDASTGWIAADDGNILYTNDGGENWEAQDKKETYLLDAHFIDANTGWIFAGEGHIFHTTNGGESWEEQETGQWADFYAGYFMNADSGAAVGYAGFAVYTTNGGQTWSKATTNVGNTLQGISFIDALTGWACGEEIIMKTTDGGKNWTMLETISDEMVLDIHFINELQGWAVTENFMAGTGKILYTEDGGDSWTPQEHNAETHSFKSIAYVDENNIWIAGRDGNIVKIVRQKQQLQATSLNSPENLINESNLGAAVALSGDYMAVGEPGNSAGYFHVYHKDADSWQIIGDAVAPPWGELGLDAMGSSLDMDGTRIISGAYGAGMGFEGKAAVWTIDTENSTVDLDGILEAPAEDKWMFAFYGYSVAISGDVAVVGARNTGGPGGSIFIYERDNLTNTWPLAKKITPADADGGEFFGHSVSISGEKILVGAPQDSLPESGWGGSVYIIEKTAESWEETAKISAKTPKTDGRFGQAVDIDGDYAVIAELNQGNAKAYIYHYNGESWEMEGEFDGFDVVTDEGSVFIGGISVSISDMQVVVGADAIDGTGAVTMYSKESEEWTALSVSSKDLAEGDGFGFSVSIANGNIAVGAPLSGEGAVYVYDPSITTAIGKETVFAAPSSFQLKQNYPNPFNPTTTIPFALDKAQRVTLKVFDMMGREVAELLNDNLAAGNYSTKFDAGNLASGVYFYTLTTGNKIVQTRKMILVR